MSRKRLALGLVAMLLLCVNTANGERPPRPPDLAVGVIPFTRTDGGSNCHVEQHIIGLLDLHGARITLLDAAVTVPDAFASQPQLDFVVMGTLTGGSAQTVFTKVFARGNTSPRSEEGACDTIAAAVARKVTDNHAAGKALGSRADEATRTLAGNPEDFNSLMTLGLLKLHANRWPEAFPFFERAVAIRPDDPQAQLNLALCYKQRNDPENWLRHLAIAETINPDDDGVLIALGNYYAQTGNPRRAVGYYERAKAFGLSADVALWNLAVVYAEMRQIAAALGSLSAIPTTSLYYTEAQPWATQLAEEKRRLDQIQQKENAPRTSTWGLLGLPDGVAMLLVTVAMVLCLVPYFGGKKFFNFDVPRGTPRQRATLKLIGPVVLVAVLAMFPPLWRETVGPGPEQPRSVSPSVVEADRASSLAKYVN